jgi:adenosine deaminase
MFDRGLRITIGSYDPPLHNTDSGWIYMIVLNEMGFTLDEVRELIVNSIDASRAPEKEKRKWRENWLTEIDEERNDLLV